MIACYIRKNRSVTTPGFALEPYCVPCEGLGYTGQCLAIIVDNLSGNCYLLCKCTSANTYKKRQIIKKLNTFRILFLFFINSDFI